MRRKNKTGQTHSFDALFDRYYHNIYTFVYGISGNAETSEDLSQETFLKLYHALPANLPIENPRAWLYRVAANLTLNLLKREKKFRDILHEFPADTVTTEYASANGAGPQERDYIKHQETQLVRRQLALLPERDRVVLMLYREGFSYAQMAQMMDIKKNAVGVIISRAIDKLEKNVKKNTENIGGRL